MCTSRSFKKNEDWDAEERVTFKDDRSKSSTKNVLVDDNGSGGIERLERLLVYIE